MELATQSEFDEVLNRHHNIQYVDAIFTDLCGYVRGKRFPILEADKIFSDGVLLPFSAFYLDVLGGVTNTMNLGWTDGCLLYTSPSPRDRIRSRMPSSA